MTSSHRPSLPRRLQLAAALSLALAATGASPRADATHSLPASVRVITVQNCNDSGPGSLRDAYAGALNGDVVSLSQLSCSTITLTNGPIESAADAGYVTLQGPQPTSLTLDGNHAGRVIVHHGSRIGVNNVNVRAGFSNDADGGGCIHSSGDVALLDMTLSDCEVSTTGNVPARGGGVRALNGVMLRRSVVTGNRAHAATADADGGGIHGRYLLTGFQSTVSDNSASGDGSHYARGGGVYASYLRGDDATFSGNTADTGGAICIGPSTNAFMSSLTNATVSGNHAEGAAGGVFSNTGIRMDNSTITGNTAVFDFGAGLYVAAGDAVLHSTIIANNTSQDGLQAADIGGHAALVIDGAHNLVMATTVIVPADTITADPMLGPLGDYGGGVLTHSLLPGSPAIDTGENRKGLYTDERASACSVVYGCQTTERTIGAGTDIGAFEFGAPDRIFDYGFDPET